MAENDLNYSAPNVAQGSGIAEALITAGFIEKDGTNTPKIENDVEQAYKKENAILFEKEHKYGREYVTYNGIYHIEFRAEHADEAQKFIDENGAIGTDLIYHTKRGKGGSTLFSFNKANSRVKYTQLGINLTELREAYDGSNDLTDVLDGTNTVIPLPDVKYFMFNTLEDYENEKQANDDVLAFNSNPANLPDYYIGTVTSDDNVGFYVDLSGRLRASYDSFLLHRATKLLQDLKEYAKPEEYQVGRLPSGTIMFVLSKDLTDRFKEKFGSYTVLAIRWNDVKAPKQKAEDMNFEKVLDIKTKTLLDAEDVFGFKKKPNRD